MRAKKVVAKAGEFKGVPLFVTEDKLNSAAEKLQTGKTKQGATEKATSFSRVAVQKMDLGGDD